MMILAAISATFVVYGMIASMLGTILPDLSERFRLSPSQNGTIAFAQGVGLMLASLAAGAIVDSEGKKIGVIAGLILIAFVLFLLPRAPGFRSIVLLLFLLGAGGGTLTTSANALISDVGERHRGMALNLVNLFFGLGGLTTPFISANLFARNWVRLCYTVASLSLFTLAFQVWVRMPGPTGGEGFVLGDALPVLAKPLLFVIGLFLFLYIGCEIGVCNWLPRHLIAQGISEPQALNILSLGFVLGLLLGRVAGLSMAPVFPTTVAIVGDAFPRMTSTAIGLVIPCGWAGLAVSSCVIGAVAGGEARRLKTALLVIPAS